MATKAEKAEMTYQQRLSLTVNEQLKRHEANELFRTGNISDAVVAYEAALAEAVLDENRLPLLSNLGLCHLKLAAAEVGAHFTRDDCEILNQELAAARTRLLEGLSLGSACFSAPVLAAKVAGRLLEACHRAGDTAGERAAVAECRFYVSVAIERGLKPPAVELLPDPPEPAAVGALLSAIGQCEDAEPESEDMRAVREALRHANGEALDEHRMNALCLAVHISCLRPERISTKLVQTILFTGAPVDARHETGRTALMLAANQGRLDLCTLLLDAGARADAIDAEGRTALHACCIDLALAGARVEEGFKCDPAGVAALLLARGAPAEARAADGSTARTLCESHRCDAPCAEEVLKLLHS